MFGMILNVPLTNKIHSTVFIQLQFVYVFEVNKTGYIWEVVLNSKRKIISTSFSCMDYISLLSFPSTVLNNPLCMIQSCHWLNTKNHLNHLKLEILWFTELTNGSALLASLQVFPDLFFNNLCFHIRFL